MCAAALLQAVALFVSSRLWRSPGQQKQTERQQTINLQEEINRRIASRIRGSLHSLSMHHNEQIDDEESAVLLVPVPLVRLQGVLAALANHPDAEVMKQEEE